MADYMEEKQYREFETLILERDAREREAGSYQVAYIKEFGELITKSFECKLECIQKKKSIAFCQQSVNRGEKINITEMQQHLDREMAQYNEQLTEMLNDYNACKKAGVSTEADLLKAKNLYRRLAKRLHPDMNPATSENETLRELWDCVVEAYHQNDPVRLKELEVLACAELERLNISDEKPEIDNLEERIRNLKDEIERIISTEPYLFGELLNDAEAVTLKKQDLQEEIEQYTKYAQELDEVLQELLRKEGMVMVWRTN